LFVGFVVFCFWVVFCWLFSCGVFSLFHYFAWWYVGVFWLWVWCMMGFIGCGEGLLSRNNC
jgi:hypothetical protein